MTVTADAKGRVGLPGAKPGDSFRVEQSGDELRLTLLKPVPKPGKARLVKRNGLTMIESDHPITQEMVRAALDEFP